MQRAEFIHIHDGIFIDRNRVEEIRRLDDADPTDTTMEFAGDDDGTFAIQFLYSHSDSTTILFVSKIVRDESLLRFLSGEPV